MTGTRKDQVRAGCDGVAALKALHDASQVDEVEAHW
jgi:hypothetical protein